MRAYVCAFVRTFTLLAAPASSSSERGLSPPWVGVVLVCVHARSHVCVHQRCVCVRRGLGVYSLSNTACLCLVRLVRTEHTAAAHSLLAELTSTAQIFMAALDLATNKP